MARFGIDLPADIIKSQVATALDLIVVTSRMPDGSRAVGSLVGVSLEGDDEVRLDEIVHFDQEAQSWALVGEPTFLAVALRRGLVAREEVRSWVRLS